MTIQAKYALDNSGAVRNQNWKEKKWGFRGKNIISQDGQNRLIHLSLCYKTLNPKIVKKTKFMYIQK